VRCRRSGSCSSDFRQSTWRPPIRVGYQLPRRPATRAGAPGRIFGRNRGCAAALRAAVDLYRELRDDDGLVRRGAAEAASLDYLSEIASASHS